MASIYDLKPRFQRLLRPVLVRLRACGVTPNELTVAALGVSLGTGLALTLAVRFPALLLLVPVGLFVRMALNALDGMMAREFGLSSPFGEVLNELGDVVSDLALILPLIAHADAGWPVVTVAVLGVINEFVGVLGVSVCGCRLYDGPMGKSDRAFALGILAVLLWRFPSLACTIGAYCVLMSAMLLKSTFNRVIRALAVARLKR